MALMSLSGCTVRLAAAVVSGLLLGGIGAGTQAHAAATGLPAIASPATQTHIPGKFIWFDLVSSDPAAAQRFYGSVFGWKFDKVRGSAEQYSVIRNERRPIGGVFRPVELPAGTTTSRWIPFASVADIGASLARLTASGASVLVPATRVASRGSHALLRDSQGAVLGILQSESGDRPDEPVPVGDFFWVDLYARDPAGAARAYEGLGLTISRDEVSGDERLLLSAGGFARAGIMKLPAEAREPGWLSYVQVEDVPATLQRVRAAGGKVVREPDPAILGGQFAVFADPQGGVLGVLHWPEAAASGDAP